jgi:hypothetical protein
LSPASVMSIITTWASATRSWVRAIWSMRSALSGAGAAV